MMYMIWWNGMMADERSLVFSPASTASEFKVHILSKPQKYSRAFKKILEYLNGIFFHKSWILILTSQEPLFGASRFVTLAIEKSILPATIIFNSWWHETCYLTRSTMKYTVLLKVQILCSEIDREPKLSQNLNFRHPVVLYLWLSYQGLLKNITCWVWAIVL